jgi:hypothetical protein
VCIGLGVLAAGLIIAFPFPLFSTLDWKFYDLRMRWRNALMPSPISESILVVGIDERDHYNYDEEFFSRWAYAKFLETLQPYRPEAVVFDILFPSRRSFDDLFAHHLRDVPSFLSVDFQPMPFERRPDFPPPDDLRSLEQAIIRTQDAAPHGTTSSNCVTTRNNWKTPSSLSEAPPTRGSPPSNASSCGGALPGFGFSSTRLWEFITRTASAFLLIIP